MSPDLPKKAKGLTSDVPALTSLMGGCGRAEGSCGSAQASSCHGDAQSGEWRGDTVKWTASECLKGFGSLFLAFLFPFGNEGHSADACLTQSEHR